MSLLEVEDLTVRYGAARPVVSGLGFTIGRGESLGMVGESGSGKTQTAMAIMGLLPANAMVSGSVRFEGRELLGAPASVLNRYRACRIAMVFQDPGSALNPYVRVGKQLKRILLEHEICDGDEAEDRALEMLRRVGLPDPERQYRAFPHQLSGGMRQRAMIGAALIGEPDLLVADEPTTALDVTVQAQILKLIRELRGESESALLLITHDLGVIAGNCERVLVMSEAEGIESGPTREIFASPRQPTTRALIDANTGIGSEIIAEELPESAETIFEVDRLAVSFHERRIGGGERLNAVRSISFRLKKGETMAVVGESGSGKTSLVRAALGLIPPTSGTVSFLGNEIPASLVARDNATRRQLQMVFQDPQGSLDPAMKVRDIVAEPLLVHAGHMKRKERDAETTRMLDRVGLGANLADRYPHELSGGQEQRVAIARALILGPSVLVCDEAVAALDGTVRQGILSLLLAEQAKSGLSIIFITHDLAVVRQISHRVMVVYMGRMCELAANAALFQRPRHPYTKALLTSVPDPHPDAEPADAPLTGEVASLLSPPPGCAFNPRCRHAVAVCSRKLPGATSVDGSLVACHRAAELDLTY